MPYGRSRSCRTPVVPKNRCSTQLRQMMVSEMISRCGATPLEIHRGGRVPGPQPQGGPTNVTGGHLTLPCLTRKKGTRANATGQQSTAKDPRKQGATKDPRRQGGTTDPRRQGGTTDQRRKESKVRRLNILQWNAEGVYQKKTSLEEKLRHEDIDILCLQETHLKENQRFNIRGYQPFRHDRQGRTKGGAALLVRNTIPAKPFTVSTNDQAEIQGVNIVINDQQMDIVNIYSPSDKDLSLDSIPTKDTMFLAVGDFNSHSEAWGYSESDKRGEEVEDWQVDNGLLLLNDPEDPPTFYSKPRQELPFNSIEFFNTGLNSPVLSCQHL